MASPSLRRDRVVRLAFLLAFAAGFVAVPVCGQSVQAASAEHRKPVLVELFTSEGCSDCPPADDLLARLDATQFVPEAQAIVLSEHVTYWNHGGWNDPFSMQSFDERQQAYVYRFRLQGSYTPQVVVDGAAQLVGNDPGALTQAVTSAASAPKQPLAIADASWEGTSVRFAVHGTADPGARLEAALAEDATRSEVSRGENAGRTLHHVAVVRVLKEFGTNAMDGRPLEVGGADFSKGASATTPVRLVVFLASRKTGRVEAVAEQTLTR